MKAKNNPENARITSGKNISYWTDTGIPAVQNPLKENLETDVVIVGGGLAGLSVAYCLTQSGKKVVLVEDGLIGSGETGRTTAHLVTALDDRYYHLEKVFGEEKTKLIAESHNAAIDFVERTVKKENITFEWLLKNREVLDLLSNLELELNHLPGLEITDIEKVGKGIKAFFPYL